MGENYGSASRSVLLLNDRRDLTTYPLASESSLRYALNALSRVMNRDEDVLFLALSSHGSRGATIEVSNEGMEPQTLGAVTLADLLAESGIRWKVIVVSACFSGGFVEPLADNHHHPHGCIQEPHLVRLLGPARPHLFRRGVLSRFAARLHATARGLRNGEAGNPPPGKRRRRQGVATAELLRAVDGREAARNRADQAGGIGR